MLQLRNVYKVMFSYITHSEIKHTSFHTEMKVVAKNVDHLIELCKEEWPNSLIESINKIDTVNVSSLGG